MKRILIAGTNSYIGTSFENYIKTNYPNDYKIDTVDMIGDSWRENDFSGYDSVFHVAGIAHIKETNENAPLYYKVNRDLPIEVAQKAQKDGVKQFIFLSSMSVYGIDRGIIHRDTIPVPKSHYGISKYQAEQELLKLEDEKFNVVILRPPMVYGKNCKGNYQSLRKIALKSPLFPDISNRRSLIFIDNLSDFVMNHIKTGGSGVFLPQNNEYIQTKEMVQVIAELNNKKIRLIKLFNPFLHLLHIKNIDKAFGSLIYAEYDSAGTIDFIESMKLTEK